MFNMEFDADASLKKAYKAYIKQLDKWSADGTVPKLASQDMRFALELQRRHWERLGLKVEQDIRSPKAGSHEIPSVSYSDRIFVNHIVGTNKLLSTKISDQGGVIYDRTEKVGTSVVVQQLKKDTQPPSDMPISCPHCGAPATLCAIENGCPYCGTHFEMEDLFPKVTNAFFDVHEDADGKKSKRRLLILLISGVAIMLLICPFTAGALTFVSSVMLGLIFGFGAWVLSKFFGTLAMMGKDLRGGGKVFKSLKFRNKIRALDPEFSTEHFRDRAMNLFRMMAYGEDPTRYTACYCDLPDKWDTVVDAYFQNFGIDKYRIEGNECNVDLTLYMDCLIYKNGKIRNRSRKYRMELYKRIGDPTDLGFSVKAVSCPSCAGTFDAEQVRNCPFCGHEYDLSRHDWVVKRIS